ncbi:hypothetical protein HHI36_002510 [Cryptolaemus montrouzieri]|uniref:Uncharacterized protein n=1 Tax=Cryptolaemus montrouzieri TaxID=559131 RepID=A0ABD2PAU3_9CUCU
MNSIAAEKKIQSTTKNNEAAIDRCVSKPPVSLIGGQPAISINQQPDVHNKRRNQPNLTVARQGQEEANELVKQPYNKEFPKRNHNRKTAIYGVQKGVNDSKAYLPFVHVSKVSLEYRIEGVVELVKRKLSNVNVECVELNVKSKQYKSFKITVAVSCSTNLHDGAFWQHKAVRKFLAHKQYFHEV